MKKYAIELSKKAQKDIQKLTPKLRSKLKDILQNKISVDPYSGKPLWGNMKGFYSVRLTYQDRVVYSIKEAEVIVYILRAKTHYGD